MSRNKEDHFSAHSPCEDCQRLYTTIMELERQIGALTQKVKMAQEEMREALDDYQRELILDTMRRQERTK